MRDYIILNGVNSKTITGLLISKLPPITKPKIRTQVEEIDGRDGDIVTKLGYSSYDKTIEIGLYGNYDVNQVISYFNSEGTIVFSNEADKYYNYQILEQIDYEKLIRFKTAKVKLHIQPFKYPLEEIPVEIDVENLSDEGEEMSLNNTSDAPMQINLKGDTSQDGIPTPSNPISVEVVTGNNTINVCGKNINDGINDYFYITGTGEQFKSSSNDAGLCIKVDALSSYTISTTGTQTRYRVACSNVLPSSTSQNCYNSVVKDGTSDNITVNTNGYKYLLINATNLAIIQIEKGSTATTYEPYQSQSYPISLGTIELCKIGNYQDYIYKDNNKWYKHSAIGKVVLDGSENGSYANGCYQTAQNYPSDMGDRVIGAYSDYFKFAYYPGSLTTNLQNGEIAWNGTLALIIKNINCTSKKEYISWLASNNVTVYYPLATAVNIEIINETLINQLENIKNARSYDTTTNINQDTNNKPFILNVVAVKKGAGEGIVVNEGNIYSRPILNIEGTGNIGIYLEGNQIFNLDLNNSSECVIDTTNLEAYDPNTKVLLNRKVTGDYNKFKLNVGNNNVKVTGNVTKVSISNYTRWI